MNFKLPLTNGGYTLVDEDVYNLYKELEWRIDKDGYAFAFIRADGKKKVLNLHRIINQTEEGMFTDHINRDRLDNRRENLRSVTLEQNAQNRGKRENSTSKYKGVYRSITKAKGKEYPYWAAKVKKDGKVLYYKTFKDEIEAAKAYDKVALEVFGEFAVLNFHNTN